MIKEWLIKYRFERSVMRSGPIQAARNTSEELRAICLIGCPIAAAVVLAFCAGLYAACL